MRCITIVKDVKVMLLLLNYDANEPNLSKWVVRTLLSALVCFLWSSYKLMLKASAWVCMNIESDSLHNCKSHHFQALVFEPGTMLIKTHDFMLHKKLFPRALWALAIFPNCSLLFHHAFWRGVMDDHYVFSLALCPQQSWWLLFKAAWTHSIHGGDN